MYELLDLPIPTKETLTEEIDACVNSLLECRGENEDLVKRLDILVYQLYGLTYDEVLLVDPNTSITREEYDNFKLK